MAPVLVSVAIRISNIFFEALLVAATLSGVGCPSYFIVVVSRSFLFGGTCLVARLLDDDVEMT